MKKHYEAPEILFEDFSLSSSIALNCQEIIGNPTQDACAYITRTGLHIFMSSMDVCTTTEDDGEYNGFCYHNPESGIALFNS